MVNMHMNQTQYKFEATHKADSYSPNTKVTVESDAESLSELCEQFMQFLNAAGFSYVKEVVAYSEVGQQDDDIIATSEDQHFDDGLDDVLRNLDMYRKDKDK